MADDGSGIDFEKYGFVLGGEMKDLTNWICWGTNGTKWLPTDQLCCPNPCVVHRRITDGSMRAFCAEHDPLKEESSFPTPFQPCSAELLEELSS